MHVVGQPELALCDLDYLFNQARGDLVFNLGNPLLLLLLAD